MLAILLRIIGLFFIATMLMLVKYSGEQGISTPEIMFWRQAMSIPLILGWLFFTGSLSRLRTGRLWVHGRRAVVGTLGMFCSFLSAILLPLAEQVTIGFTAPVFAVILSAIFMAEKVGPWRWSAVILGLAGVLVITQPGASPVAPLGVGLALAAAVIVAFIGFLIRDLAKTEDAIAVVFYFAVFGSLFTAAFLPFYFKPHSSHEWLVLAAMGVMGMIGQFFLTLSLRYGQVATVVVMDYSTLIWATLYGWLVWEVLPVPATWLGAPVIILAGLIITWREHRLSRPAPPTSAHGNSAGV